MKKFAFRIAFAAAFLLLLFITAAAELLPLKTYTSADGLIYEGIKRIYQDSRGFVWFCTPVGVSRFDGYQFTSYGLENGLAPNPTINDIVEDEKGIYWLGTNGDGVYRFDPRNAAESKFALLKISDNNKSANNVNRFFKTSRGAVFAGTAGGLFRLNDEQKFAPVELKLPFGKIESFEILSFAEDAEGSLWVGHEHGLARILPDGTVIHYEIQPDEKSDSVRSLTFDMRSNLWLISEKRGLFVFNPEPIGAINTFEAGTRKLRLLPEERFPNRIEQGFAYSFKPGEIPNDGDFNVVRATSNGKIWLSTRTKGLVEFDGETFHSYTKANGLSDDRIFSLLEDSFGNLWIGSGWGAMRFSQKGFTTYNQADGLADNTIFQTFQAASGKIYVVNPRWLVNEFDGNKFIAVQPNLPPNVGKWHFGRTLLDRSGHWWFGTESGVFIFPRVENIEQLKTAAPKSIFNTENGLPFNDVLGLFEDSRGDVWLSYWNETNAHLTRWERNSRKLFNYSQTDGVPSNCAPGFFDEDASGNVFAYCSAENLIVFHSGKFTTLASDKLKGSGEPHGIHIDLKGSVWLATSLGGLIRIENPLASNPEFTIYTTAQGLSSNHIQYVTEDNAGRIYFVTSRGMDRLEPKTGIIKYYTLADGLAAAGSGLAFRAADGNLWLGTSRGLSKFVPETAQTIHTPPVFISNLRVAGTDLPISALGDTEISGLTLEPDQRQMQIDFYGISLATGEALRYQYKLRGGDGEDWSAPSNERRVNFPNIAAGDYQFLVRAVGADGGVSEKQAVISFKVLRPVWQRWWFLVLTALVIGFLIYLIYRYRVAQLLKLERVRTRIATDLHDDIGSSLSQIAILSEVVRQKIGSESAVNEPLKMIAGTSREMVDAMSDIVWAINPEKDHLADLVQRMRRFASDVLEAQEIVYRFEADEKHRHIALGADVRREVYLIFKESINNAVKHAEATAVEMSVRIEKNTLIVKIKDDGKGFVLSEPSEDELFSPQNYDGFGGNGLINIRRRAESFGGRFTIESALNEGTEIIIEIPLR